MLIGIEDDKPEALAAMTDQRTLNSAADYPAITLDDVRAAAQRINGAVVRTPTLKSLTLSELAGAEVWLKFENLQFTAAYKERGALNTLLQLSDNERGRGVIAASAGNHSQGLAYHAARLGIAAMLCAGLAAAQRPPARRAPRSRS